jgi:SPP1 gp7 family putative phage head morphogenesis protein
MAEGKSFNSFKKEMHSLMEEKGWYGRSDKGPNDKDYINWRIKLIYHTNMSTAYNAGRYRQQVRGTALRPIWEYVSKLVGKNRRQDHIALHGKAFRWDDPIWNEIYPDNNFGCECSVITLSEAGAEREGIEILHSDADGNPPALVDREGNAVDWNKFAPEAWRYNPGREALAPNFRNYTNLANYRMDDGRSALAHVAERYRQDMDGTRLTSGEFDTLIRRINEKDYTPQGINYQVGNLDRQRHEAMINSRINDSKIMAMDSDLYHGIADKNTRQKIPQNQFKTLYQMLQTPERIFEETILDHPRQGRVFHFVHDTHDGKVLKVVLGQQQPGVALRITTMGWVEDHYGDARYKKIW